MIPLSVKYQVLSKYTSFLGINKNDAKPVGEIKKILINKTFEFQIYGEEEEDE